MSKFGTCGPRGSLGALGVMRIRDYILLTVILMHHAVTSATSGNVETSATAREPKTTAPTVLTMEIAGHYQGGFEVSSFVPCGFSTPPGSREGYWLNADQRSAFSERYGELKRQRADPIEPLTVFVRIIGKLHPWMEWTDPDKQEGYGHLGAYYFQIDVLDVLEMKEPTENDCRDTIINALKADEVWCDANRVPKDLAIISRDPLYAAAEAAKTADIRLFAVTIDGLEVPGVPGQPACWDKAKLLYRLRGTMPSRCRGEDFQFTRDAYQFAEVYNRNLYDFSKVISQHICTQE